MPRSEAEIQQEREQSIQALDAGKLPVAAAQRISAIEQGVDGWTSDLSVQELAAILHAGFTPIGMVMGSAVYRVAAQWGYSATWSNGGVTRTYPCPHGYRYSQDAEHRSGYNWEHTIYEAGLTNARNLALERLIAEAMGLSAHGVVGVEVRIKRMAEGYIEFTLIGTAVRRPGAPPVKEPFTSHITGQDFSKTIHAGFVPVRLVIGIGALEIDPGCGTEFQAQSWANQEIQQISEGVAMGRQLAVDHLGHEVVAANADGAIGVDVRTSFHELANEARLIEMFCIGTAVRQYAKGPMDRAPSGIMRLK